MPLPFVAADKANHFIYGTLIYAMFFVLGSFLGLNAIYVGAGVTVAFAVIKELFDYLSNQKSVRANLAPTHGVELLDVVWTIAPAVIISLMLLLTKTYSV